MMTTHKISGLVAVPMVAGLAWFVAAGPLTPPATITPSGKSTQEIYDAILAATAGQSALGRAPGVPGANRSQGSMSILGAGNSGLQLVTVPILGVRYDHSRTVTPLNSTSPPSAGKPVNGLMTVVREPGTQSGRLLVALASGKIIASLSVSVPSAGGNTVFTLTNAVIVAIRQANIQRPNGTFGVVEEIDLAPTQLRVTDSGSSSWNFNFNTGLGGT